MKIAKAKLYTYVQPLVKRGCCAVAVAEFPFRHAQEVAAYLSSIQPEIADTVAKPSSLESIQRLYLQLATLNSIDRVLATSFKRDAQIVSPSLIKTKASVLRAIVLAEKKENVRALSKEAPEYTKLRNIISASLGKMLRNAVCKETSYALPKGNATRFAFTDLRTLSGFSYPEFYVELVSANNNNWLSTSYNKNIPKIGAGTSFAYSAAALVSEQLLTDEDFIVPRSK